MRNKTFQKILNKTPNSVNNLVRKHAKDLINKKNKDIQCCWCGNNLTKEEIEANEKISPNTEYYLCGKCWTAESLNIVDIKNNK